MDRETFKTLSAGKFALMNLEDTIDKQKMLSFIEGSVFAYDFLKKIDKTIAELTAEEGGPKNV